MSTLKVYCDTIDLEMTIATTWVHHICSDINTSALDALCQTQDRFTQQAPIM